MKPATSDLISCHRQVGNDALYRTS